MPWSLLAFSSVRARDRLGVGESGDLLVSNRSYILWKRAASTGALELRL